MISCNEVYSADLVATYEELMNIPHEKRVTAYFGDYSLHYFKYGTAESQIRPAYENALKAMEMSEQEFQKQKKNFLYRGEMIGRMRDCLLSHELHISICTTAWTRKKRRGRGLTPLQRICLSPEAL